MYSGGCREGPRGEPTRGYQVLSQNYSRRERVHSFIRQIFPELLLCDRSCARHSGYRSSTTDTGSFSESLLQRTRTRLGIGGSICLRLPVGRRWHLCCVPSDRAALQTKSWSRGPGTLRGKPPDPRLRAVGAQVRKRGPCSLIIFPSAHHWCSRGNQAPYPPPPGGGSPPLLLTVSHTVTSPFVKHRVYAYPWGHSR